MSKNVNKILKMLELEIYEESPYKQELVNYIRVKGYENIKNAFDNKETKTMLNTCIVNSELSYSEIISVLTDIEFHLKY